MDRAQIRENTKDLIYRELDVISQENQVPYDCLHAVYEMVDIIKDLEEVDEKEMINVDGYSQRGYSNNHSMMPRYYDGGNSYGSGNYNISGTYNNRNMGRNGYSRSDGNQDMTKELEKIMNETRDEHVKESVRKILSNM